jgi:hypothetical protein
MYEDDYPLLLTTRGVFMDTFTKDGLNYEYTWSLYEKNDPKISGVPDDTEFNRKEGLEVLYIINCLTDHLAYGVDCFGNKVEQMIHDQLPKEIKDQKDAIQWIKDNWKNFVVKCGE